MSTIGERISYSKQHYQPGNIVDGAKIIKLREALGWSAHELARRTDMEKENLERIERGDGNTSTGKIGALARVLNVHPVALIRGAEDFLGKQEVAVAVAPVEEKKEDTKALMYQPDRDVTLIRTFAGDGDAYLQIGELRTDIPEEILGDVLHVLAVYRLRNKK